MQVTLKLYASLTDYLPPAHRVGNQMGLEVTTGATLNEVIAPFKLPAHMVHLVLVNGHFIAPEARAGHALAAGDVLAIWPPIAGG
jgi:sulfur carrier protein ThiS